MIRPMIAANWKENKTNEEAMDFVRVFMQKVRDVNDKDIVIAPSFVALTELSRLVLGSNVMLGSQSISSEEEGAFTGEVSVRMVKGICSYAMCGHSERRLFFKETNGEINKKMLLCMKHGIMPILCIGETAEERKAGKTFDVIKEMLDQCLRGIESIDFVVAYEPVWAISRQDPNTKPASAHDAESAHAYIRKLLAEKYGSAAENVRIIYGGSVKPDNIQELMMMPNINGALVGGASLDPDSFAKIVKF